MSEEQILYDENLVEEEEYSFNTATFEALRCETEYDDSDFSEEEEESDNGEDGAIFKNIINFPLSISIKTHGVNKSFFTLICVIILSSSLGHYGSTKDLWRLWQLVKMWEVDGSTIEAQKKQLENLGVCYKHFLYNQNQLHESGVKQKTSVENSILHHCHCCFCGINKYFYSRGKCCKDHS
jgi:hypothetical protein